MGFDDDLSGRDRDDAGADAGPRGSRGGRDSRGGRRARGPRRRHPLRALASVIGVLALLGVLVLGGYALMLQNTISKNIEHKHLKADDDAVITLSPDAVGGTQPIVDEDGKPVDLSGGGEVTATSPERDPAAGDALNFLVIGSDSRDLSVERGRSDVIVLMHINDARDRVDLIHFPRDLFVPIPGTGGSSKINAAYSYGGAPLLVQTLQPLVDVPIDHVVIVNFESFKAMTDSIGGVDVQVTEAGGGFAAGTTHMDGEQGLRFVRERYSLSQGDISRGERQMQFVKAIMLKALSRDTLTNPARLARFVDAATTNLTVDDDLKVSEMRDLGFAMRDVRGRDVHFSQGPWCGIQDHPVAGSIILMAQTQMKELSDRLRTDTMEDYVDTVSPRSGFGGTCG